MYNTSKAPQPVKNLHGSGSEVLLDKNDPAVFPNFQNDFSKDMNLE